MKHQIKIDFDRPAGEELAKVGMQLAVETADKEHGDWSARCWLLFYNWLNRKPRYFEFMVEDFRKYVEDYGLLEKPKSDRAFGMVSTRARSRGLIEFVRTQKVKNKKAHAATASVWMKK